MKVLIHLTLSIFILNIFSGCVTTRGQKALNGDVIKPGDRALAIKLFKEGASLLYENDEAALSKFLASINTDPSFGPAYYNAGVTYERLGKDKEAEEIYSQCLLVDREDGSCLQNLVVVKMRAKKEDEALLLVEQYLNDFPENTSILVANAKFLFLKGDIALSEKYAREAIERQADNLEALYVMMRIFFISKQYAAAKLVAKNALELAPSHGAFHLWLGHIYVEMGLLHDALDQYQMAIVTEPTPEALENAGLLLLKFGKMDEAIDALNKLVAIRPYVSDNWLHIGNAYLSKKDFSKARQSYEKALELNSENKDVLFNLGLLYLDLKPENINELDRLKTSQEYFKKYIDIPSLSKERNEEVNSYLQSLAQKIEMEESALEFAKQAAEEEKQKVKEEEKNENPQENEIQEENLEEK